MKIETGCSKLSVDCNSCAILGYRQLLPSITQGIIARNIPTRHQLGPTRIRDVLHFYPTDSRVYVTPGKRANLQLRNAAENIGIHWKDRFVNTYT